MRRMWMRYRVLISTTGLWRSSVGGARGVRTSPQCAGDDDDGREVERKLLTHVQASVSGRAGVDVCCGQGG